MPDASDLSWCIVKIMTSTTNTPKIISARWQSTPNGNLADPASLDSANYNPIDHLNLLFTQPSSLASVSRVSSRLIAHNGDLSRSIHELEAKAASSTHSTLEKMRSAQAELHELFSKVEQVRSRALQTETNITTMTADIKRLDGTKRNLTHSMTALKRLQMLTTAYEQLCAMSRTRQYRDCAGLLAAVIQLMRHFNSYRSIDQIATLSKGVSELQRELLEQVCEDFEMAFAKGEVLSRRSVLVDACRVIESLGDGAKARLITWYVNTELREYRQVFRGSDEAGSLDNIGRRYAWFRRMMKTHDDEYGTIFPPHWKVAETLATAFCDGTREDFKGILERSMRKTDGPKLNVNLLLGCLQETMEFEQGLERRFSSEPRASMDTLSSYDGGRTYIFNGSISVAFEPHLSLWIEEQDRQLASMIPSYKLQPLLPEDEEFSPQAVIPSAIELFHFYKVTLSQCAKLSTSDRLLDLSKTFAKYLDEYAQQVLLGFLQRNSALQGPPFQNIILVLNTADFWHVNANQLEENIRKRIDPELVDKVDLSSQADAFLGVASAAVLMLVQLAEKHCEGPWREMRNTNWSNMESAGDQSSYVGELVQQVNEHAEQMLRNVHKPQYARAFCDHLVEHVSAAFISNMMQCRPIAEVGAEQMLLDKYVLTKAFENLLSYHSSADPRTTTSTLAPSSFTKRVNASMTRIDPLLKTLQVRPSPPEGLVQAYLIHIGDKSEANFRKILELKGVRRSDQTHLVEMYTIHRDAFSGNLVASSPLLTPLVPGGTGGNSLAGNGSMSTAAASASASAAAALASSTSAIRFDPTAISLGEKLFSVARDGVERIGTAADKSVTEKNNINENLRSIGKFFRRDIGFGARFAKGPTGGE